MLLDGGLPDIFASCLGGEDYDPLALVHHHPFDQHQSDVGLAQTHAVAEESAPVKPADLDQIFVGILLVDEENAWTMTGDGVVDLLKSHTIIIDKDNKVANKKKYCRKDFILICSLCF